MKEFKENFYQFKNHIHMNNAGLAPISIQAKNKIDYWSERFYQEGFFTDADYMTDVLSARKNLALLIGCEFNEIAFFQSTASAISQLCFNYPLHENDEVIMWDQEYSSNLYPWQEACRRKKAKLVLVESENHFQLNVERLLQSITNQTKVIAVSWVQFQTGAKTDLKKISEFIKDKNIFLFVDIMQGLGLHPFNMKDLGVDAVAGGSHKWLVSPVGVGYLALDKKYHSLISPHNVGSSTFGTCDDPADLTCEPKKDALKFEPGSKQVLEITALGASVEMILKFKVSEIEKKVLELSQYLKNGLEILNYKVFYNQSSIVNFVPKGQETERLKKLNCCFAVRGPGIRLSPHAFNTPEELDRILNSLK